MERLRRFVARADFVVGAVVLVWAIVEVLVGSIVTGVVLAVVSLPAFYCAYQRSGRPPPSPEEVIVPGTGKLVVITGVTAGWFGAVAILSAQAGHAVSASVLGLACLAAATLAAAFEGLRRTAAWAVASVEGEPVRARGMGRGGHGLLGAQVVVVTERRVIELPARPWGVPSAGTAIPVDRLSRLEVRRNDLVVEGEGDRIVLKKCPSPELLTLAEELRGHLPQSVGA